MPDDRTDRIRQRAHEIWEREGRADGRDAEHWSRAEAEIAAEEANGGPSELAAPAAACSVEAGPVQDSRRRTRAAPKARRKDATPPPG
ncbi:DUF2934 domain-containing protein [Azospirillum sp. RWY-5-1]|uniref:DUF2934 domain-containing protein n=1 Tax=Azospirillum oleiclasticum TaxID=2735135 RepID=A0ABX2TEU3_9PROT|nr:DUF2934 domain-containing protein [Azospirillum oleiclasticum]NYZ14949.1 DUF2934 domain-containing protein [Azospirillum oleiclasticum]NYZ22711.1 DUF2934 domain-containing protein [Azospirillum oleiclasticum]